MGSLLYTRTIQSTPNIDRNIFRIQIAGGHLNLQEKKKKFQKCDNKNTY